MISLNMQSYFYCWTDNWLVSVVLGLNALKRHKEIHVVQGRKISSLRVKAATPDQIKEYFHKYDLIVRQHQIPNENIFIYDESGFIMGQGKSSRVAVPSYKIELTLSLLRAEIVALLSKQSA